MTTLQAAVLGMQQVRLAAGGVPCSPTLQPVTLNGNEDRLILTCQSGGNLRIKANGHVDLEGGRGPWAQFLVEAAEDGALIRLKSVGHHQQFSQSVYLTAATDGGFLQSGSGGDPGSWFSMVPVGESHCVTPAAMDVSDAAHTARPPAAMELTAEQKQEFARDGVLVLKSLIPSALTEDALRTINAQLGAGRGAWGLDENGKESLQMGNVGRSAALRDLLVHRESPLLSVAENLLGTVQPPQQAQVALRFPMAPQEARTRAPKSEEQWHIDGMNRKDHLSPFQLLVGIALSSQPTDECGNLHVWPGHHVTAFNAAKKVRERRAAGISWTAEAGSDDPWLGLRPSLPADGARQVHLEPGDVVLAHQKTPHRIGLNRSPNVRYQVYFRLSARGYAPDGPLGSLFDGWRGMAAGHASPKA